MGHHCGLQRERLLAVAGRVDRELGGAAPADLAALPPHVRARVHRLRANLAFEVPPAEGTGWSRRGRGKGLEIPDASAPYVGDLVEEQRRSRRSLLHHQANILRKFISSSGLCAVHDQSPKY